MNQNKITIQTNNGRIVITSNETNLESGKCKGCGNVIYFVKNSIGKPIKVSKLDNGELINHYDDCNWSNYLKKKKYEEKFKRFRNKRSKTSTL